MGTNILELYKKRCKYEWKVAFISTFLIGLLTHIYKFTNTLLNHDSLYSFYHDQNIVQSGRWFLSIACSISSYFDLPWVTGLLSVVFISLTTVVITEIFEIKNPVVIALSGGILVTFPAITTTFMFQFTADGYMLSMLLSAVAVYLTMLGKHKKINYILAGVCICLSCAIYQAYISFALLLILCHFIYKLFENSFKTLEYLKYIRNQVILFAVSLAAYFAIWKICLFVQNVEMTSYKHIDEVGSGQININTILHAPFNITAILKQFFFVENTLHTVLSILFITSFIAIVLIALVKTKLYKRKLHIFLLILCIVLMPCCIGIWYFTTEYVEYNNIMLQSIAVLYIFALLLYDRYSKAILSNIAGVLYLIIILNFALQANIVYFNMHYVNQRTYATACEIAERIHTCEDGENATKIAVLGELSDERIDLNSHIGGVYKSSGLYSNLMFDQSHIQMYLNQVFGMKLEEADETTAESLLNDAAVQNMGIWPDNNSLMVIDDVIVIKLSE